MMPYSESASIDPLIDSLADRYLDLLLRGEKQDRRAWLAQYPAVADLLDRRLQVMEMLCAGSPRPPRQPAAVGDLETTVMLDASVGPPLGKAAATQGDGDVIHRLGYVVVARLGTGSFGRVYCAWDPWLRRFVAVKLSHDYGHEGQTLATLEHDHIVRVFAESVDRAGGLRVLCMQYVPGPNLATVITALAGLPKDQRTGRAVVGVIDATGCGRVALDPAGARDREFLLGCDFVETICWVGGRLAAALAHAHGHQVLHRDIKPANILLHPNGRPMLADFNLASLRSGVGCDELFGGTLNYMAPEHLDAYNPASPVGPDAVDARSDVYALGVVLHELATGDRPFAAPPADLPPAERFRIMSDERRRGGPLRRPTGFEVLDRVIRRCLEPDPARRYQSAKELSEVLDGCMELYRLNQALPTPGPLTRAVQRNPPLYAVVLPIVPHLVGAMVAWAYAAAWVASHPEARVLEKIFSTLALGYSAVAFPLTGWIAYQLNRPVWRAVFAVRGGGPADAAEVTAVRQLALWKPFLGVLLSCGGWLVGAVLLPVLMMALAPGTAGGEVFLQYFLSFLIAGLIALTYTEFIDQYLLLCIAYPSLWVDPVQPRRTAKAELGPVDRRFRAFQVLSTVIPLLTAVALLVGLVFVSPQQRASPQFDLFLVVVIVLVVLAMAGTWLGTVISGYLSRVLSALQA